MSDGPSNGVAAARLAALSAAMDPDEHQRVEALLARSGVPWVTETYGTGAPGDANLADLGTAERDEARALLAERASLQWAPPREISWPRVLSGECLANRLFTRRALIHKGELARALQCWRPWSAVAADGGGGGVDKDISDRPCPETHCVQDAEDVEALRAKRGGAWVVKPVASSNANKIVFLSEGDALPPGMFEEEEGDVVRRDGGGGRAPLSEGEHGRKVDADVRGGRLRVEEWVMQRHIDAPLLTPDGRKFHIRAFLLVSGRVRAYLHDDCFALVASRPYVPLGPAKNYVSQQHDPYVHLTNRSVAMVDPERGGGSGGGEAAAGQGDDCLRPLADVLPANGPCGLAPILSRMRAAAGAVVAGMHHDFRRFCPLANTFEVFGLDFLVAATPAGRVYLLEANACPRLFLSRNTLEDALPLLPAPLGGQGGGEGGTRTGAGAGADPSSPVGGQKGPERAGGWQRVFPL